jgi:hypothetical protein
MRNLCKQLFPEDSIGITMVRILEMLVENPDSELAYKSERVQVTFIHWNLFVCTFNFTNEFNFSFLTLIVVPLCRILG